MQYSTQYLRSFADTVWIYPTADLEYALSTTTVPYTFDGTHIVCSSMTDLIALYTAVFDRTAVTQPVGNAGYSLGVGSHLQDLGKELLWLVNGHAVLKWRLLKQLTPQLPARVIPVPGNSPADTIGYGQVIVWRRPP
jgi:hypothetical protein